MAVQAAVNRWVVGSSPTLAANVTILSVCMNWTINIKKIRYDHISDEILAEVVLPIMIGTFISHGFFTIIFFAAKLR